MIIALIVLLLFSYVRICIVYENDLKAYVKLFGLFRIRLYPSKEPKKYISAKKLRSIQRKAQKPKIKKSAKKLENKKKNVPKGIGETVNELYSLISIILKRFAYKVKVRVKNLDVCVATDDAAKTALAYFAVCNSLELLSDLLSGYDKLKCSIDNMSCRCDFVSESFSIDVDIEFKIRIHNALLSVIGIIIDTLNKK